MNGFPSETREGGRRYPHDHQIRPHPIDVFSGDFGDNFYTIRKEQQRSGRASVPAHLLSKQENGVAYRPVPPPRAHIPEFFDLEGWNRSQFGNSRFNGPDSVPWRQQNAETHQQPPDIRGQFRSIADQSTRLVDDLREPYSLTLPSRVEVAPPRPPRNPQPYYPYRRPTSALADPFVYSNQQKSDRVVDPLRQQNREQLPSIPAHLRNPFASIPESPENIRVTHRTVSEPNGHDTIHALDILSTSLYDPNSSYYTSRNNLEIPFNNNKLYYWDTEDLEEDDMSKTTPNWRNNFSQMRQKFGNSHEKSNYNNNGNEHLPYAHDFSFASDGSLTMPRNRGLMKSASHSGIKSGDKLEDSRSSSLLREVKKPENHENRFRRNSEAPESKKPLGNFWLETVRNRAASPVIQKAPFKLVTTAQERLEQLHEPIDDETSREQSVMNGKTTIPTFRRIGSDSVAQRKLSFTSEMDSSSNGINTRTFPSERFVSERKSFSSLDEAVADLKMNTEKLMDSRGCGKFPLDEFTSASSSMLPTKRITVFTGTRMSPPRHGIPNANRQHSPSPDSLSGESTASLANLPHPKPKHNIREQLMNMGAGNTYLGPYMGRRPSTPNFPTPSSGTVASKISVFEKRPGTPTLLQLAVGTTNSAPEAPRSPLSPRTTIFKTKPIIHVDLGHDLKERTGAISPEYDNKRIESVSTSAAFNFPKNNNVSYSPRWRNDPINEAQPLSIQQKSPQQPAITLSSPPTKLNLDFNLDQTRPHSSLGVSKTIPTTKSSTFNDSINLTIEPKKLPPLSYSSRSKVAGRLAHSERFYYPTGKPVPKADNDSILRSIQNYFCGRQLLFKDFGEIAKMMKFPLYSKRGIFEACCQCNSKPITDNTSITFDNFVKYWEKMIQTNHDEASRFIFTLTVAKSKLPSRNYLLREDFHSIFYDLIQTYPGLQFLIEATQFHARYVEVVTARIFWNVNKSWSDKITVSELRASNLLQTMHLLEETDEINKITEYFSYEHFYVIYCKFWELDEDHDMIISKDDMRMHCNGALTNRIIDRIFSTAVTKIPRKAGTSPRSGSLEVIGFEEFVSFLLAEEDKRHPKAIEYWFRCIDLDGDGVISFYEMELFYKDVATKIQQKGYETLDFKDVASQLYDLVSPAGEQIMLKDLKRCGLAHRFFNTFVNYLKYLEQESADGERASVKMNGDKEMSDWDQFCALEYEMLMAEADQGDDGNDEAYDLVVDDEEEMASALIGSDNVGINGF